MTYSNVTTNTRVRISRTLYYLEVKYVEKSSDFLGCGVVVVTQAFDSCSSGSTPGGPTNFKN